MADFYLRQGDALPKLAATFTSETGAPVDLTGCTVTMRMRRMGYAAPATVLPCAVVDAAAGRVEHAWQAGETDTPGDFRAEFMVSTPLGIMTIPNDRSLIFTIATDF